MTELIIAKRNEERMKQRGAKEFGQLHYRFIVLVHSMFFVVYFIEETVWKRGVSVAWPLLLSVFILTQIIRFWALLSLGKYWNTKIIVLPNAPIIQKGPYRLMKHPNYLVVTVEFIIIPLLFNAYLTATLFTILNGIILAIRIPAEERALHTLSEYKLSYLVEAVFPIKKGIKD